MARVEPVEVATKDGRRAVVRTAEERDAEAMLANLELLLEDGEGQVLVPGEIEKTLDQERAWIRAMRDDGDKLLLVAEVDGALAGTLDFKAGPRRRLAHAGMLGIGLVPAFRGLGLGTALVARLLAWAAEHPRIERIELRVLAPNTRAMAVYRKLGFVEEGRFARAIKYEDGTYADDVWMARFV